MKTTILLIGSLCFASAALAATPIDTSTVPCDKPGAGNNDSTRTESPGAPCNFGSGSKVPPEIPADQTPAENRAAPSPTPTPASPELKGLPGTPGTDSAEPIK